MQNDECRTQNEENKFSFILHSAFIILTFLLTGCSPTAVVTVKPTQSPDILTITFPRAFYLKDQSGQDQIVLESSPIDEKPNAAPGDALAPEKTPPLWQVLLIQLQWRSLSAGRNDSPVADNAVLHWYVYGKPDEQGTAILHYIGTGAVSVSSDSSGSNVRIHRAELHLTDHHGSLHDPLVDFQISTHFHAVTDDPHFHQITDDLQKAIADAGHGTGGPATMPSR